MTTEGVENEVMTTEGANEMSNEYKEIKIKKSRKHKKKMTIEIINSKQDLLLTSLIKFYDNPINKQIIVPIIKQETAISLRLLDWLVTNYSKKFDIHYELTAERIEEYIPSNKNFNLWLDYKNQLKAYSKRTFDPFCRRQRIFLDNNNNYSLVSPEKYTEYGRKCEGILTTVGQLNFFKWAITNKVIDYAFDHLDEIETDMLNSSEKLCLTTVEKQITEKTTKTRQLSKNNHSAKSQKLKVLIQFC
jgi:hypothetical protein